VGSSPTLPTINMDMNNYWYNQRNGHLCTDKELTRPFLCESEATPLEFDCTEDCFKYLQERGVESIINTTLQDGTIH
jgi:hypothetical protein